jgi:hypothetical protein
VLDWHPVACYKTITQRGTAKSNPPTKEERNHMAVSKQWNVGEKASIMVGGTRRAVEVVSVDVAAKKAVVKFGNGQTTRVYLNALIQPEQTHHFRNPKVNTEEIATALNALSAEGYMLVRIGKAGYGLSRLLVVREIPPNITTDVPAPTPAPEPTPEPTPEPGPDATCCGAHADCGKPASEG